MSSTGERLSSPNFAPCDERGFYYIFHHNIPSTDEEKIGKFVTFTKRFIKKVFRKIINENNERDIEDKLLNTSNNINILYQIDFYMFKELCNFIVDSFMLEQRLTNQPGSDYIMHGSSLLLNRDSNTPVLQERPDSIEEPLAKCRNNSEFNHNLICYSGSGRSLTDGLN